MIIWKFVFSSRTYRAYHSFVHSSSTILVTRLLDHLENEQHRRSLSQWSNLSRKKTSSSTVIFLEFQQTLVNLRWSTILRYMYITLLRSWKSSSVRQNRSIRRNEQWLCFHVFVQSWFGSLAFPYCWSTITVELLDLSTIYTCSFVDYNQ